jgi:hypothetical protein
MVFVGGLSPSGLPRPNLLSKLRTILADLIEKIGPRARTMVNGMWTVWQSATIKTVVVLESSIAKIAEIA